MNSGSKSILLFVPLFFCFTLLKGQELHKHFEVDPSDKTEKVYLKISTKAGKSFLNAVDDLKPLVILGASENDVASSTFRVIDEGSLQSVDAKLTCKSHMGLNFTEAVANSFFSDEGVSDIWQINLSKNYPLHLDLNYLMGNANVDLSNLAVERLKIRSGSADVDLGYSQEDMNRVAMDTFFVKVNFGNINVKDLNRTAAKEIIAEVGFGSLQLDCGDEWKINSRINASVGAGSMAIQLPPDDVAVLIRISDSPLCNIKMAKSFKKIGHNTFANEAYQENPNEKMEFMIDVGMGSITFLNR